MPEPVCNRPEMALDTSAQELLELPTLTPPNFRVATGVAPKPEAPSSPSGTT
ncbi:MAG: hypothetical protein M1G31_29105 [Pseudanabaena sp. Salubria-1]|nr:hypothetical protein [Pseudanabaena sp. Salubria-1]